MNQNSTNSKSPDRVEAQAALAKRFDAKLAEHHDRYWSVRSKRFWRMPVYIWIPLVSALALLLVVAFYKTGAA